jgi:hypothetical protein
MTIEFAKMMTTKIALSIARAGRETRNGLRLALWSMVTLPPSRRLTLALSGRPTRFQARGRRKLKDALAARRSAALHGPLERVVRPPPNSTVHSQHHYVIDEGSTVLFNQDHFSQILSRRLRKPLLPDKHNGLRSSQDGQQLPLSKEALFPLVGLTDML